MGIIGCPENPILTNFSNPINNSNDTKFTFVKDFPQQIGLFTTDSLPWKSFTPRLANMDLGNAINRCKYRLITNSYFPNASFVDIEWNIQFVFNSTYSPTAWVIEFPPGLEPYDFTNSFDTSLPVIGQWLVYDESENDFWEGFMFLGPAPTGFPGRFAFGDDVGAVNQQIQQGTPITFASGDRLIGRAKVRVNVV